MSCCSTPLDQFFTPPATAAACWSWLQDRLPPDHYFYCEPSVGRGAFYDLLPPDMRIGFELDPDLARPLRVTAIDFLEVQELAGKGPLVVVGNPPFGRAGALAVQFVNKAFELGADYVAMILPAAFRPSPGAPGAAELVEAHTINRAAWRVKAGRTYGEEFIGKCDFYLPAAGYDDYMRPHDEYCQAEMIGVIVKRDRDRLLPYLRGLDWRAAARRSGGRRLLISPRVVERAVAEGGFADLELQPPVIERRIVGGRSIAHVDLDDDAFELPDGKAKKIPNCAFVLYRRGTGARGPLLEPRRPSCKSFAKVYTIWRSPPTGLDKIDRCSVFVDRRGYKKIERATSPTEAMLKNNCYGVELLRSKDELKKHLLDYDWTAAAQVNSAGGRNINKSAVQRAIIAGGFVDD